MQYPHPLAARASRALATGIASLVLASAALFTTSQASAQDGTSALVDALVRKGVLTNKEAGEIREDLARDAEQNSAGKIKLSNSVTELRLYGDIRMRYEFGNRDTQYARDTSNDNQTSRFRFRLRINAEAQLGPEWFAGFSLGTGQAADSEEQTFENGFDDYGIFITRAYLGWTPTDWFTAVAGKQKNPLYTTDLVWDPDITPNGFTQTIAFHKLFGGAGGPTGYAKDDKTVVEPVKDNPWSVTLVAGQFIFDDNNEFNLDNDANTDAWLFVEQIITSYKFNKDTSFTIAPGFMTYTAADLSGLTNSAAFTDAGAIAGANPITAQTPAGRPLAAVSGETRQLNIITAPGDISFKLGGIKSKLYWDFAYNFNGRERFEDIYQLLDRRVPPDVNKFHYSSRDGFAWLAGFQLGELKRKGDFAANFNYREVGLAAIDPNLNDSTWAQGRVNQRGFKLGLSYQIADPVVFTVTGYWSWNLNDDVVGGRATNLPNVADANDVKVLQVDLAVKF